MDGAVTSAEYESSLSRVLQCFRNGSVAHSVPKWDPVSNTSITFLIRTNENTASNCMGLHWSQVDGIFRQTTTPYMNKDLLAFSKACLSGEGYDFSGVVRSFNDLADLPTSHVIPENGDSRTEAAKSCVLKGIEELYAETIVFSWR